MIEYKEFGIELIDDVYKIYQENNWKSYLGDLDKLKNAFLNSLYILGAFDNNNLVGFIRCIGDKEYILYIQDLIVLKKYRRQGIGKSLMQKVNDKYKDVKQLVLITDANDQDANAFYQAIGLDRSINGFKINTYFKQKNNF